MAFTYSIPLFLAGFPAWYIDHPLFVVRVHMERRAVGFAKTARNLYSSEGLSGFFAGSQTYGFRSAYLERRLPTYHECMTKLIFSVGCLRLPVAFAFSGLSRGYFNGLSDNKEALCCFFAGCAAALFSCPAESLMRHSVCTHADRVTSSEKYNNFRGSPWYSWLPKKLAGLDPVPPSLEQYQTVTTVVSSARPSNLFRGWPLDCTRFGLFFLGFSWTYRNQTGHYPNNNWMQGTWRLLSI